MPENLDQGNQRAYCPGCHLAHDQAHHWQTRRGQVTDTMYPLFDLDALFPASRSLAGHSR